MRIELRIKMPAGMTPNAAAAKRLVRFFMSRCARTGARARWSCVAVALTDDAGIAAANARLFGLNRPTDALSVPYAPMPGEAGAWRGEVFVNVQRAGQAGRGRMGPARELALYLAHACDHLSGASDRTRAGRRAMRRRELRWVAEAARKGLLRGLLPARHRA